MARAVSIPMPDEQPVIRTADTLACYCVPFWVTLTNFARKLAFKVVLFDNLQRSRPIVASALGVLVNSGIALEFGSIVVGHLGIRSGWFGCRWRSKCVFKDKTTR
jgi:hypothetical protein